MTEKDKQPKRQWLQFRLRTFLIVLAIFCVWIGWHSVRAERQRAEVKWVQENGGTVYYDYEYDQQKLLGDSQPPVPKWLLDYFYTVEKVSISNTDVSDVTPLATLKNLRILDISGTRVSDVTPLATLKNLRSLRIPDTRVSDVTLLAGLTNLEHLSLANTQVTDFKPLSRLTNLVHLELDNTKISDVTPLAGLTSLENLWLDNTQVSDVTPLAGISNLRHLDLRNTKVSDEDFEKLGLALPNCNIFIK